MISTQMYDAKQQKKEMPEEKDLRRMKYQSLPENGKSYSVWKQNRIRHIRH